MGGRVMGVECKDPGGTRVNGRVSRGVALQPDLPIIKTPIKNFMRFTHIPTTWI